MQGFSTGTIEKIFPYYFHRILTCLIPVLLQCASKVQVGPTVPYVPVCMGSIGSVIGTALVPMEGLERVLWGSPFPAVSEVSELQLTAP